MDFKDTHEDWESEAPFLAKLEKKNPFTVPTDYFEGLTRDVQSAVIVQTLKETIRTEPGYTVPEGYFDSLDQKINQRLAAGDVQKKEKNAGKLRPLWLKYTAAASIALILSIAALLKVQKDNSIEGQLNRLPESEIITYLQLYSDRSDTPVIIENLSSDAEILGISSDLSQDEIEEYINTASL